ncbi:hypothetical protein PFNF135_00671 [Plasmodium falciparum NF135/5.C10]|uniref:Surface antigen n=1 Tax=Plasmodium falciparum NF135/5.C10 TaxID=1036726 RepID=W4IPK4_PLAFA|nr:hypothetical protein PFNF135_00671 [Plasmodium falciparum NF135/5.C10]
MKVHYINILLLALSLNILVINTHKKLSITPRHIQTTRLLCECELYVPNYDNDPEMKKVMQQFHDRTTQRFQEYDERLQERRQICKDKCDKEIQKIILKDKLEKELMDKFATLDTDIQSDAIPSCVCEKSLAEKAEKGCLRCGYGLGSVAPMIGLTGSVAVNVWKTAELAAAKAAAIAEGTAAGIKAGVNAGIQTVISGIYKKFGLTALGNRSLDSLLNANNYNNTMYLIKALQLEYTTKCVASGASEDSSTICIFSGLGDSRAANVIAQHAKTISLNAGQKAVEVTSNVTVSEIAALESTKVSAVETTCMGYYIAIISSIVAIVVIVLFMVIIYLILRHRRKRKMKKKFQYIKLLKE